MTEWSRVDGLGTRSLFLLFLFSSVFHSTLHPLWAHQLPGMVLGVSPSVPLSFSFSSLFSLFFPSCLFPWRQSAQWSCSARSLQKSLRLKPRLLSSAFPPAKSPTLFYFNLFFFVFWLSSLRTIFSHSLLCLPIPIRLFYFFSLFLSSFLMIPYPYSFF